LVGAPAVVNTVAAAVLLDDTVSSSVMLEGALVAGSILVLVYLSNTIASNVSVPVQPAPRVALPVAASSAAPTSRLIWVCPGVSDPGAPGLFELTKFQSALPPLTGTSCPLTVVKLAEIAPRLMGAPAPPPGGVTVSNGATLGSITRPSFSSVCNDNWFMLKKSDTSNFSVY